MKALAAIGEILKREGVEFLTGFPVNPIIEAAAAAGIRPIIVRQERTGAHMADGFSRISAGERVGVFVMQVGPGAENAFGGVAQAYGDSVPIVVLPTGYRRQIADLPPNFKSSLNYGHITKWCERVTVASAVPEALRRAFTQVRNGRPRPVLIEWPVDLLEEDVSEPLDYVPALSARSAPDPRAVQEVARVLGSAARPVIYAGQGVHYARAWRALRDLAEQIPAPVVTSLAGKSAFPEDHPLSLGCGARTMPATVPHFLERADVILGIGCSFTRTAFGVAMPQGKSIIHATLDPADLNKDLRADYALIGDARLTLEALLEALEQVPVTREADAADALAAEIATVKAGWLDRWRPTLTSNEVPFTPYRIIWDLMHTVDRVNTIITHDAGGPRDQLSPFWESVTPLSYIGWGKTTQLGSSLGFTMGAKLAEPGKLCIAVMGDTAIGMTGLDFETAAREQIPILVVLLNNSSMACELAIMPVSTERYGCTSLSGDYTGLARALGGYGERVTEIDQIVPAIRRAIAQTEAGVPALLEFITAQETALSR
jgi:acetolactate synthase-1/2/3 large subunit